MKKRYEKPVIREELFLPNEYISSCGDSGVVYNFECNAGHREYEGEYPYKIYDNDGNLIASRFEPCKAKHEAESSDTFFLGYMDDKRTETKEHIDVYIWAEKINSFFGPSSSYHCTDKLNKNEWETAKS